MTINVEINVLPVRDGDIGEATITIWKLRHGEWEVSKTIDVVPGTPIAKRVLLLDLNEQLTISGDAKQELVYDREQNMVTPRTIVR